MLTEKKLNDEITITERNELNVRESTVVERDGVIDPKFPPSYQRYVLAPGDSLDGRNERVAAVARAVWTAEAVEAYRKREAETVARDAPVAARPAAHESVPAEPREGVEALAAAAPAPTAE
jgi:hypothetical protein